MNTIALTEEAKIENMIYEIRGKQVMLDSDLAKLYECAKVTKSINLAVQRNIERFPQDFYFQLTNEEFSNLRFQFETSKHGVAMLASVLRTAVATKVSIIIMQAFVIMRKYISKND